MNKLILALVVLPLLGGVALAKSGGGNGGGHGGATNGGRGGSYGGVDPADLGPLAQSDWRVQWVLQHGHPAPVAAAAGQPGPAS